jgi:VWFA-related protein
MYDRTQTAVGLALVLATGFMSAAGRQSPQTDTQGPPRFKSGVDLVNVTATVSDGAGRFVSGLRRDDFVMYEDDEPQTITQFSAERVPVSLGLALDTSGSMAGEKIRSAQSALSRFLALLDARDEMFLYRFSNEPVLLQGWTNDHQLLSQALTTVTPRGGTAMYDAVARSIGLVATGRHQKKALVVISDGNDTLSRAGIADVKRLIRDSDALVYAIGIDGRGPDVAPSPKIVPRAPFPMPPPYPGGRRRGPGRFFPTMQSQTPGPTGGWVRHSSGNERVNLTALRDLTDDSGGRTEVITDARDLNPATAGIADELSRQYDMAYASSRDKDGRWHSIRVEVPGHLYRVRARRGYTAS